MDDLIYTPAKRGGIGVLVMIAGASGSGKTLSALRLATGLANGGPIFVCDTEHGRALIYADDFTFNHLELKEPFTPQRFEAAAVIAQKAGAAVWVCDSFSHEHVGPGGVLDMFETELQKMTKGDISKRDALKYAAWITPKMQHKHLLQRLWQLNCHIVLCCHGEKKLDLIKNERGKMVPNPDAGPSAVCSPDIPFAMTASFLLEQKRPGVPTWMKHLDKWDALVPLDRPLDEATGKRIGAWARGEKPADGTRQETDARVSPGTAAALSPRVDGSQERGEGMSHVGPDESSGAGQLPLGADEEEQKIAAGVLRLIQRFEAVKVRADHLAIVDAKTDRERITWIKKSRKDLAGPLKLAMQDSWDRTQPPAAPPSENAAA